LDNLFTDVVLVKINSNGDTYYDNNSGVVYWDPSKAHIILTENGTKEVISPGRALLHEFGHRATAQTGEADEVLARALENQIARELGEPIRAIISIDLGFVTSMDVTAHTEGGKWVTVDPNTLEKVMGANYDPSNPVYVIGTNPQPSGGNGGEESGVVVGGGGGGVCGTTSPGGQNPNVDINPVEPIIYNPDPETDYYGGGNSAKNSDDEIIYSPTPEFAMIEVVGTPEPLPLF
jgi:hypothetical protein